MSKTDLYKEQITKAINAFSQKRFDEAEGICLKILSENNNPDANHILGCIRMSEGKYDDSISFHLDCCNCEITLSALSTAIKHISTIQISLTVHYNQ